MVCEKCGARINEDDVFCSKCGNKIDNPVEETRIEEVASETIEESSDGIGNIGEIAYTVEDEIEEMIEIETDECEIPEDEENSDEIASGEDLSEQQAKDEAEEFTESIDSQVSQNNNKTKKILPKRYKRSGGAHFCAVCLSILLSVLMIATLSIFVIRNVIADDTIKDMISNFKLGEIKILDKDDIEEFEELGLVCDSDNLLDIIYDNIDQSALNQPLSKEDLTDIIEDKAFTEFFGGLLSKNIDSLVNNKKTAILTSDDIAAFLEKEKGYISDIVGYEFTQEHIDNLKLTLETDFSEVFDLLSENELRYSVGKATAILIHVVFSDWLFVALITICALLMLLIFLVLHSFHLGLNYNGITLIIINFICLIASMLFVSGWVLLAFLPKATARVLADVVGVALWDVIIITAVAVFVGIIMVSISAVIRKYLINKQ